VSFNAHGSGKTTRQILEASMGAVFIWHNACLDYPKQLIKKLGRKDIQVVGPSWLTGNSWRGIKLSGVIMDHFMKPTVEELDRLWYIRACIL
jgi:hypothetical protein